MVYNKICVGTYRMETMSDLMKYPYGKMWYEYGL